MKYFVCCLILFSCLFFSPSVHAADGKVKISKIVLQTLTTPPFKGDRHSNPSKWVEIIAEFSSKWPDQWIDELEVRWTVGVHTTGRPPILMKLKSVYLNIEDGQRHRVNAYISPNFFARYREGHPTSITGISVLVELYVNDKKVDSYEKMAAGAIPKWKTSGTKLDFFLRPKNQTPFSVTDYDYYEDLRPE